MASRSKRERSERALIDGGFGFSGLLAMWLWGKSKSLLVGVVFFLTCLVLLYIMLEYKRRREHQRLIDSGLDIVDQMDGELFEDFLLAHFRNLGYSGQTTPFNDYGADLILDKDGMRTVVQAKRWKQPVGIEAIQQVIGAISYYGAQNALVITNSVFTNAARDLARANKVGLWDREQLMEVMRTSNGRAVALASQQAATTKTSGNNPCPKCGRELIRRKGKFGDFYGCTGYPACKFTRNAQSRD